MSAHLNLANQNFFRELCECNSDVDPAELRSRCLKGLENLDVSKLIESTTALVAGELQRARTAKQLRKIKQRDAAIRKLRRKQIRAKRRLARETTIHLDNPASDEDDTLVASIEQPTKSTLTQADLEFDYDRNRMRDRRLSPGRVNRPRHGDWDLTHDFKSKFSIPQPSLPSSSGDLSGDKQKSARSFPQEDFYDYLKYVDPAHHNYDLYACHRKGRDGSPSYDNAGYQLDWEKVDGWMKSDKKVSEMRFDNGKKTIAEQDRMNREERWAYSQNRLDTDNREMEYIFFSRGLPNAPVSDYEFYMRDRVSKDLGVPYHQVTIKTFQRWERRLERKMIDKPDWKRWWRRDPSDEDKAREHRMRMNAHLRKDVQTEWVNNHWVIVKDTD
ncbi:hypothetical protein BT63DRAFT_427736 [Microthyrium microscopicum]|uniref:Uncharacterized protein n=1 Tax=Microthyrium microscopicum TaxID=703497 RepID=A0A6A6U3E3_9PEZI|nr:hypothetical protein BT63DRAFT_427736 [Microthyrium microscopicum]